MKFVLSYFSGIRKLVQVNVGVLRLNFGMSYARVEEVTFTAILKRYLNQLSAQKMDHIAF